jgi:hypothetical protein
MPPNVFANSFALVTANLFAEEAQVMPEINAQKQEK